MNVNIDVSQTEIKSYAGVSQGKSFTNLNVYSLCWSSDPTFVPCRVRKTDKKPFPVLKC